MARRGGTAAQRLGAVNGVSHGQSNGHPPPSTIPAQIIRNAVHHTSRSDADRPPFLDQVKEFLRKPDLDDPDDVCNAFVFTITEGGIDPFFNVDPFTTTHLEVQGTHCITALQIIFQQKPHLLLAPVHADDGGSNVRPPLLIWLLPKLLGLLALSNHLSMHHHVGSLLETCRDTFTTTIALVQHAQSVARLYKSCVDSVLAAISLEGARFVGHSAPFRLNLPASSSIADFWPESQQIIALPQGVQRTLTTLSSAAYISLYILQILSRARTDTTPNDQHDSSHAWILGSARSLWKALRLSGEPGPLRNAAEELYMAHLSEIIDSISHSKRATATSTQAISTFASSLLDYVHCALERAVDAQSQVQLASLLIRIRALELELISSNEGRTISRTKCIIDDSVRSGISQICQQSLQLAVLHRDLQLALCLWTFPGDWPQEIERLRTVLCSSQDRIFSHGDLHEQSRTLVQNFRDLNLSNDERPTKRHKTLPVAPENIHLDLYQRLLVALNGSSHASPVLSLANLHNIVQSKYTNLPEISDEAETAQIQLLTCFEKIACAGSHCLSAISEDSLHAISGDSLCSLCDRPSSTLSRSTTPWNRDSSDQTWKEAIAALIVITREREFQKSLKARILMAVVIGRLFTHISDSGYLDLSMCTLGEWLLKAMTRSSRELRIAASRSLRAFLHDAVPKAVRDKNRRTIMQFFVELTNRNDLKIQETLVMAYGQAARVCSEAELHIILCQLVEYLGHTNIVISSAAFNELAAIAEDCEKHPEELLAPYWRTIGFSVVSELYNRPQKAQNVCDLIGKGLDELLAQIHGEVLPVLVLNKRKDVLQRIASAKGTTIEDICFQPRQHLARIIAVLLCQEGQDVEKRSMDALVFVASGFRQTNQELHHLVQLDSAHVACEVLKLATDRGDQDKSTMWEAFIRVAILDDVKDGQRKAPLKKKRALELFLSIHILGIMAHFSDVVENLQGKHPVSEQKRCVGAIKELITLAGADCAYALPQIRACLQSAMADTYLCDQAFDVWCALLAALEKEHLEQVVDQTFALVVNTWSTFSEDTQVKAYEALESLRREHNSLLQDRIGYIPSLGSIPMLSKLEAELARLKAKMDPVALFDIFSQRCQDENTIIVRQALMELVPYLESNQKLLHQSAVSQKPMAVLTTLCRSLLDVCARFAEKAIDIPELCAQVLGLIGGLDPYRVETVREKKQVVVLSNFESAVEVINFAAFMLEEIIITVFLSTTNTKSQGYLAYLMQELCKACGFSKDIIAPRSRSSQPTPALQRWQEMSESVQKTLSPFLSSKYVISGNAVSPMQQYPIFVLGMDHDTWLRRFTQHLLHQARGDNAKMIFPRVARVARLQDLSISSFILPYAVLNVIVEGEESNFANITTELLTVLHTDVQDASHTDASNIKQCSENVFQILDYLVLWLQEKRKASAEARVLAGKTGRGISEKDELEAIQWMSAVERLLQVIPAKSISRRAVECGSFARALFHWEQYFREEQAKSEATSAYLNQDSLLHHLQMIYAQIDEPDSIEGISAHMQVLNSEQQIMEHRKAGRWTAALSWYELAHAKNPTAIETQIDLMTCLKETGQHDAILNYADAFEASKLNLYSVSPFIAEAAWSTGRWTQLEKLVVRSHEFRGRGSAGFNVGLGQAFIALRQGQKDRFQQILKDLRASIARELTPSVTASLQASHDHLMKLHTVYEVESIVGTSMDQQHDLLVVSENLDRRLDVIGAYPSDKQYILGVRRAAMSLSMLGFTKFDAAAAWLTTARLQRQGNFTSAAFSAIHQALQLGDDGARIEYSKMLWKEGHHRKAIQHLRRVIATSTFRTSDMPTLDIAVSVTSAAVQDGNPALNKVKAHAQLILAKWLDRAGQTQSSLLKEEYSHGIMAFPRWDKGHYYLGRYYLKLHEAEKALPASKQATNFIAGELTKLVIENYIRSTCYGAKYYYQTIPKILTLWLDMGMDVLSPQTRTTSKEKEAHQLKLKHLEGINAHIKRYAAERMPAYPWYTAFSQIITRISHPNKNVWDVVLFIIIKVAGQYPQQSLWSLLAVLHSTQDERRARGQITLQKLRETGKRKSASPDLRTLIIHGQRLTDALLAACDAPIEQRVAHVSLSRDLGFNLKLAPCWLVVPIEASMMPTLPAGSDSRVIRAHNPFPQETITIQAFEDDVLVLSSLQRPRKLVVRGSDGRSYGLLCKPKDDLRKDQRLMEFNTMINRALQKNTESSRRRLYIKTYGVTPLNEECGTIEWVEGLKPMRDIIIRLYRQKGVSIDYGEIRLLLTEASSDPSKVDIFTQKVLARFPPVLYEWFVETFPQPEAWFAARLRYTRSCAVMSIVGHVLGLGDRHGENVLLEEGNGGTFHVDFNCLFDKGLTFEKPELVPFRLTHNMVDAMGPSGIEGPFRRTCELTYSLLRQHHDTLITILETFVHDPTTEFLGTKKKRRIVGVPETPHEVLEIVRGKVNGFVRGDSVPLSEEGYVDMLLSLARDPKNLAAMYIGWCAFF